MTKNKIVTQVGSINGNGEGEYQARLYTLAHDIKGPLNQIKGLLDIALKINSLDDIQQYLEMAIRANHNVNEHIRELLDGHYAEREEIDLRGLILDSWRSLQDYYDMNDCQLLCPEQPFNIINRKSVIKSVIHNLLENAIKYRKAEEPLRVTITMKAGEYSNQISISDNGLGIREEDVDKIFSPNYQEDDTHSGHGIGLFLVKQHLANIGGTIKVESEVGVGTTFSIVMRRGLK